MTFLAGIALAVAPFLGVVVLLWNSERIRRRRLACVARQIAVTDAIHRELGAAAAPVVERSWRGLWTVGVAVPLDHEGTVGAIARIAHEVFSRLDPMEAQRLRIVFNPGPVGPGRWAPRASRPTRGPVVRALTPAGTRLG